MENLDIFNSYEIQNFDKKKITLTLETVCYWWRECHGKFRHIQYLYNSKFLVKRKSHWRQSVFGIAHVRRGVNDEDEKKRTFRELHSNLHNWKKTTPVKDFRVKEYLHEI